MISENAYYLESGLLRAKNSFFRFFDIEDTRSMPKFQPKNYGVYLYKTVACDKRINE